MKGAVFFSIELDDVQAASFGLAMSGSRAIASACRPWVAAGSTLMVLLTRFLSRFLFSLLLKS